MKIVVSLKKRIALWADVDAVGTASSLVIIFFHEFIKIGSTFLV
jgi:hypothetical protein